VSGRRNVAAVGAVALLMAISLPLFAEFFEPRQLGWDIFLGLFLVGLIVAAVGLLRFFRTHAGEIGEARFDTTNKGDVHG
jgi:Na+/melibiose symporter-like transporter